MDLKGIVAKEIMSTDLTTVLPTEKLSTVEVLMIKNNVGGIPVVNESNKLIGIITHRDIQISKSIIGSKVYKAQDLMSSNPVTCTLDAMLPEIVKKMAENDIERIPIVNEESILQGIIVTKDIIETLANVFE